MITPVAFVAEVQENIYIAKETRETLFRVDEKYAEELSFSAGQFFNIVLPDPENPEKNSIRAYSVASSPKIFPEFRLCVKVIDSGRGLGSGFIDRLQSGEKVKFSGPFGHFGQKFPEKKCVMVATGTGIAPMKSIIDEQEEEGFPEETTLVFGVREEEYAFYRDYFSALAEKYDRFSFFLYISRPEADTVFTENVREGRVTAFFADTSAQDCADTEFLICGNPAMVKEVRKILKTEMNVDKKHICVEAY